MIDTVFNHNDMLNLLSEALYAAAQSSGFDNLLENIEVHGFNAYIEAMREERYQNFCVGYYIGKWGTDYVENHATPFLAGMTEEDKDSLLEEACEYVIDRIKQEIE